MPTQKRRVRRATPAPAAVAGAPSDPNAPIEQYELDGLALAAAGGDRDAEARVCVAFTENCKIWAAQLVGEFPRLLPLKDELIGDALHGLVGAIRRYRGGSHFPHWAAKNVRLYLRRKCRPYLSHVGARGPDKGMIDLESAAFRKCAPVVVGSPDNETMWLEAPQEQDPNDPDVRRAKAEANYQLRWRLGKELQKLPPMRRTALKRQFGIEPRACFVAPEMRKFLSSFKVDGVVALGP